MGSKDKEEQEYLKLLVGEQPLKVYSKGTLIYNQGESPNALYVIESGLVGLLRSTESGQENLLRIFKDGQIFGHRTLFADEFYHGSAKCLEETSLRVIPKKKALEIFNKNPRAYFYLAKSLAKELRRAEVRSVTVSEGDILQRVSAALILFKRLYPEHLWTRTEIANYCASRTPTVITALGKLENMGAITQNRREINIVNEELLLSLL